MQPWQRNFYFDGEDWFPVISMNDAKGGPTDLPEVATIAVVRHTEDTWATYDLRSDNRIQTHPVH